MSLDTWVGVRTDLAVLVTIDAGPHSRRRRYVVDDADTALFDQVRSGVVPARRIDGERELRRQREEHLGRFSFGAQWLRGMGRVDEMARTLSTWEITKVERLPRTRVRGT